MVDPEARPRARVPFVVAAKTLAVVGAWLMLAPLGWGLALWWTVPPLVRRLRARTP